MLISKEKINVANASAKRYPGIEVPNREFLDSLSGSSQYTATFRSRSASAHKAYHSGITQLLTPIRTAEPVDDLPLDAYRSLKWGKDGPLEDYFRTWKNGYPRPVRNEHLRTRAKKNNN